MLHKGSSVFVEIGCKGNFSLEDVPVDAHGVLVVEGVDSGVHFVDKHSKSPPIHGFSMALIEDDLRSDVLRGSTDGEGSAFDKELGKSKVSQFEVTVITDEEVLGLEVSEDDVLAVKVFEARGHNGCVEAGLVGGEGLNVAEVGEEFSSVDEL